MTTLETKLREILKENIAVTNCDPIVINAGNVISQLLSLIQEREKENIKDTERLDFLDKLNHGLNQRCGTTYGWELITNHNVTRLMREKHLNDIDLNDAKAHGEKSCRDVIDQKMKKLNQPLA